MAEDYWWEEHCSVIPPETLRLIVVGCVGSILAIVSAFSDAYFSIVASIVVNEFGETCPREIS
ncbi:hypothetical protein Tcan_01961 [Toxocara canis]|uniref:Uncharacterized protein n=1 Tax=Toxocara canis TaxID=6265 RepID=A0A0B2VCK4_TOXCA|nr:hypothetical protein Tcan_01961 [Toxocara canis]